jgi:hypothetical protein
VTLRRRGPAPTERIYAMSERDEGGMLRAYEAFEAEHGDHEHVRLSVFDAGYHAGRRTAQADLAALERDNARLRAVLERAADLSRVSYYDRAACGLCKRFEGHEHDCPFAALSPERPGDAGMEGR